MSDLMRGEIAKFSIEKLVRYADRLGLQTTIKLIEPKTAAERQGRMA